MLVSEQILICELTNHQSVNAALQAVIEQILKASSKARRMMANTMKPFIHLIADYGIGDPAFSEVIARLKRFAPEAEIVPTAVPPFSTLATGFWIGQLGLYDPPNNAVIYANTAPRKDSTAPRRDNVGEPLVFAQLTNGVRIVGTHAGYCFSFVKEAIKEFQSVKVDLAGSQFRSRDIFPDAVARITRNDYSILGHPLPTATIPDVPKKRIAFIDGYGNIKITIRRNEWYASRTQKVECTTVAINGISKRVAIANGIFSVPAGSLVIAPGSSGGNNPFLEISKRSGSAAEEFNYPIVESTVMIQLALDQSFIQTV